MSWLTPDKRKPKSDTRRKRKKPGRRKEQGGHKRINISIGKNLDEKLDKIREQNGNISQFIENEIIPALDQLDPGDTTPVIHKIELYLRYEISQAFKENKLKKARTLVATLDKLEPYTTLADKPPLDPKLLSTETEWAQTEVRNMHEDLVQGNLNTGFERMRLLLFRNNNHLPKDWFFKQKKIQADWKKFWKINDKLTDPLRVLHPFERRKMVLQHRGLMRFFIAEALKHWLNP